MAEFKKDEVGQVQQTQAARLSRCCRDVVVGLNSKALTTCRHLQHLRAVRLHPDQAASFYLIDFILIK